MLENHIVPALAEKTRLQEYATSIFTSIRTRSGIKKAIKRKQILVNGEIGQTGDWVKEGQKIELLPVEKPKKKVFRLHLEIVFEDEDLAIINKSSGYPTSGNYFKTIENALPFNLKVSPKLDALAAPLPAHRLDTPTSGLLICAKTRSALLAIQEKFKKREIGKIYAAVVKGRFPPKRRVETPITGKKAITRFKSWEQFQLKNSEYSLIKAFPQTGRTHQIRIHLAGINFPIKGDLLYGGAKLQKENLYLASIGLKFYHPLTSKLLVFEQALPKKFQKLLKESKAD